MDCTADGFSSARQPDVAPSDQPISPIHENNDRFMISSLEEDEAEATWKAEEKRREEKKETS